MVYLNAYRAVGILGVISSVILYSNVANRAFVTKAFPLASIILLFVLSLLLIVRKDVKTGLKIANAKQLLLSMILFSLYLIALKPVGFMISTFLFLTLFLLVNRYKTKLLTYVLYCIGTPIIFYVIFNVFCGVDLPEIIKY